MESYIVLKLTVVLISINSQAQTGENRWSYFLEKTYKIDNWKEEERIINQGFDSLSADHHDQVCERHNSSPKKGLSEMQKVTELVYSRLASGRLVNSYFCETLLQIF